MLSEELSCCKVEKKGVKLQNEELSRIPITFSLMYKTIIKKTHPLPFFENYLHKYTSIILANLLCIGYSLLICLHVNIYPIFCRLKQNVFS